MKSNSLKVLTFVLLIFLVSSCNSWHDMATFQDAKVETGFVVQPMVAEIDSVSAQIMVDTIVFTKGNFSDEDKPSLFRESMIICARKHNFDILVNPTYQIFKKSVSVNSAYVEGGNGYYNDYYVVISGYPAYFKRIRPASPEDSWMVPFYNRSAHIEMNSVQQNSQSVMVK